MNEMASQKSMVKSLDITEYFEMASHNLEKNPYGFSL